VVVSLYFVDVIALKKLALLLGWMSEVEYGTGIDAIFSEGFTLYILKCLGPHTYLLA
jgi:hypothetical protein